MNDRSTVAGKCVDFGERGELPIARAQDNWNDSGGYELMQLHRALHFNVVAVIGGEEVRADEEQDDVRGVELVADCAPPLRAGTDAAVVSLRDEAFSLQ